MRCVAMVRLPATLTSPMTSRPGVCARAGRAQAAANKRAATVRALPGEEPNKDLHTPIVPFIGQPRAGGSRVVFGATALTKVENFVKSRTGQRTAVGGDGRKN